MPKTNHYAALNQISEAEWAEFFPPGLKWTTEDEAYLREWYGRDHIVDLAYALGKTPWAVRDRAKKLGLSLAQGEEHR